MSSETQMFLNKTQLAALNKIAVAELRTPEQMLSLIMAEGVRFYFCDYVPPHGELNAHEIEEVLMKDATKQVASNE